MAWLDLGRRSNTARSRSAYGQLVARWNTNRRVEITTLTATFRSFSRIQQDDCFHLTFPGADPGGRPIYEYVEGKTWSRNLTSQALDPITESYGITRRNVRFVHVTM